MAMSRRDVLQMVFPATLGACVTPVRAEVARKLTLISAPTNLGLRPAPGGAIPGTWKMPRVLLESGLAKALGAIRVESVPYIAYEAHGQRGTRIRNGNSIRLFSLELARKVADTLRAGEFPVVLGGDCSVMLGSLLGARWQGGRGLIHIDGHSDFFHPGNYDTSKRLGSVAGMDLALATGRGEPLLTQWPDVAGPLVSDGDAMQIGEREAQDADYMTDGYGDIVETAITRITMQELHKAGLSRTAEKVIARLKHRRLAHTWLHVDFDVLDQAVLPAVDSPGSPGLTANDLSDLIRMLVSTQRVIGADFAIYDPDLDPGRRYSGMLVDCIASGLGPTDSSPTTGQSALSTERIP
jgi:arginase